MDVPAGTESHGTFAIVTAWFTRIHLSFHNLFNRLGVIESVLHRQWPVTPPSDSMPSSGTPLRYEPVRRPPRLISTSPIAGYLPIMHCLWMIDLSGGTLPGRHRTNFICLKSQWNLANSITHQGAHANRDMHWGSARWFPTRGSLFDLNNPSPQECLTPHPAKTFTFIFQTRT